MRTSETESEKGFSHMRMVQRPRTLSCTVRCHDIPFICIMVPARIRVFDHNMKRLGPGTYVMSFDLNDIRITSWLLAAGDRYHNQRRNTLFRIPFPDLTSSVAA